MTTFEIDNRGFPFAVLPRLSSSSLHDMASFLYVSFLLAQNEDRTLWDATSTYVEMSPFMSANKIKKPILLIHGEEDNNSGTLTMQVKGWTSLFTFFLIHSVFN